MLGQQHNPSTHYLLPKRGKHRVAAFPEKNINPSRSVTVRLFGMRACKCIYTTGGGVYGWVVVVVVRAKQHTKNE